MLRRGGQLYSWISAHAPMWLVRSSPWSTTSVSIIFYNKYDIPHPVGGIMPKCVLHIGWKQEVDWLGKNGCIEVHKGTWRRCVLHVNCCNHSKYTHSAGSRKFLFLYQYAQNAWSPNNHGWHLGTLAQDLAAVNRLNSDSTSKTGETSDRISNLYQEQHQPRRWVMSYYIECSLPFCSNPLLVIIACILGDGGIRSAHPFLSSFLPYVGDCITMSKLQLQHYCSSYWRSCGRHHKTSG